MKLFIFVFCLVVSSKANASNIVCEAWFHSPGSEILKQKMDTSDANLPNVFYHAKLQNADYRVQWSKELTTFYVTLEMDGVTVLTTTARVPSENHPENFTDLNLPRGNRYSVNCEMK